MSNAFKDSPRERVRVANGLTRAYRRYYHNPDRTVSSALFSICILQTCGDASQGDTLLNLADLIDPTCSIVRRRNASVASGVFFEYDLSCGHTVNDIDGEPPTYCPVCGRRLVENDSPEANSGPDEAGLAQNATVGENAALEPSEGEGNEAAAFGHGEEEQEGATPEGVTSQQVQAAARTATTVTAQAGQSDSPTTGDAVSNDAKASTARDNTAPVKQGPRKAVPSAAPSAARPDDPAANGAEGSSYPNPYNVRKAG